MSNTAENFDVELGEGEAQTEAPAAPTPAPSAARMCKGQMPTPLVWYIKFHEPQDNKSAVAAKYFTTPGKITDIQSNSNQKYVVKDMVFTDAELDAAAQAVRANFVRGQEDAANGVQVTPRKLATTVAGDEAYSLEVIEKIRAMEPAEGAIGEREARDSYNQANPRKTAEAASSGPAPSEPVTPQEDDLPTGFGDDDLLS